ncbi:MAG TPA: metal ABC transporter permease, partial [Clostridia bacterium]|nr:metal ABC transporter permease [Clostridia bacterium]
LGAFGFAVASSFGIGFIKRKGLTRSDVIIGMFWSLGMALGIFFIALSKGYPPDLSSYLFGSILSVTRADLVFMACLAFAVLIVTVVLYNYWKAFLFDEEFASLLGIKTAFLEYLLLVMVALSVVVLIKVVGIILTLALLCAPAAVGGILSRSLAGRMVIATLAGAFFCVAGLWVSYTFNVASGASIVVISVICYLIVHAAGAWLKNSLKLKAPGGREINE